MPQTIIQSGIYIPGNGKGMVKLKSAGDRYLVAAGQNRGPLKVFQLKRKVGSLSLLPGDVSAVLTYKNGLSRKLEFYYGSSFLSQSARFITTDESMKSLTITNDNGQIRNIEF
jgi:hypothetical protein